MKGKQIRIIKKNNPDSLEYHVGDLFTVESTWFGGVNVSSPSGIPLSLDKDEYELVEEAVSETTEERFMRCYDEVKYGMHDCEIKKIKYKNQQLILKFKNGIARVQDGETSFVPGKVVFGDVDMDFCDIYIINSFKNSGRFRGKKWRLSKYLKKHDQLNMIVLSAVTEGYDTIITGCMWENDMWKEFILEIFCTGGMEYVEKSEKM